MSDKEKGNDSTDSYEFGESTTTDSTERIIKGLDS